MLWEIGAFLYFLKICFREERADLCNACVSKGAQARFFGLFKHNAETIVIYTNAIANSALADTLEYKM